jgi:hypothetical protein
MAGFRHAIRSVVRSRTALAIPAAPRRTNCYDLLSWRTFKELSKHIATIADGGNARSDGSRP